MPDPQNLRAVGDRIEQLLEELRSSVDGRVWERVEETLRLVTDLYGAALARVVELADRALVDRLTGDDLVASLLVVHGLHPEDVTERVGQALDHVRPYLGSHGGDVELLAIEADRVRLRMLGSCHGCPSSSVTLKLAVEQAIFEAAPEIVAIDVVDADIGEPVGLATPVQLGRKPSHSAAEGGDWSAVHGLSSVPSGSVTPLDLGEQRVVVCRVGSALYAYRDECPACGAGLVGASLDGEVLRCRSCRAAFDVRLAGRSLHGLTEHLDPLPLLQDDRGVRIAVTAGAAT